MNHRFVYRLDLSDQQPLPISIWLRGLVDLIAERRGFAWAGDESVALLQELSAWAMEAEDLPRYTDARCQEPGTEGGFVLHGEAMRWLRERLAWPEIRGKRGSVRQARDACIRTRRARGRYA